MHVVEASFAGSPYHLPSGFQSNLQHQHAEGGKPAGRNYGRATTFVILVAESSDAVISVWE
jgi:hypothetical protein